MSVGLIALCVALGAGQALCQELAAFSYPDTATARAHWEPQFGSKPVRVENLADGTTCLALDAEFALANDRACWDWLAELDLSEVSRISFEISAEGGGIAGNVGIYFGTDTGWYARFWWWGSAESWTPRTFRLDDWGTEEDPGGWDKVTRFRFSIWSSEAGKATYHLRNLCLHPRDPGENLIKNGSFEIVCAGMPYAWGSGHWGVGHLPWAADMDLWRSHWRVDESTAEHGARSLLINNAADLPLLKACSVWVNAPKSAEVLALSAWLRSDQDELPVTLSLHGRESTVRAGREWAQASLTQIPPGKRMLVTIAPQAPGKLWIDAVQLQATEEPTPEFHEAYVDAGIAAREETVDWSPPRRAPEVAAGRSVSGPVAPAEVSIDEHGRALVDGRPYIQHSLGLEFVADLDILDFVAQSGFRDVCCQIREDVTTARLREIFDRCARVGLRIIPWLDGRMSRDQFREHIGALKDHPALLCWYVFDEPSGERFAEADHRYRLARNLDPAHPALINYLSSKLEDHTGDIYSTDVYPIPHSTPLAAVAAVRKMKAAAAEDRKPVWMWLQGTGYAYWMDREPSPRELSCMVYGSLIEGARGVYYFAQVPRTKECFDEMRAMCVEVEQLTPALSSLEPQPKVSCDTPAVSCRAYRYDRSTWLVSVNTTNEDTPARFGLGGAEGQIEVVFEGRSVTARDGGWTDGFGPYERHVYRVDG